MESGGVTAGLEVDVAGVEVRQEVRGIQCQEQLQGLQGLVTAMMHCSKTCIIAHDIT
jgi:hypothetical protein